MRGLGFVLLLASACALTSRGETLQIRYFSAEPAMPAPATPVGPAVAQLRLDEVLESSNLDTEIMHRVSSVEAGSYEELRWNEPPSRYVKRALSYELFELRPLEQILSGPGPALDVQVIAFEQVATGGRPGGRVTLVYRLSGERAVLARGTVTKTAPARSAQIGDVVVAIRTAMMAAAVEVADRVLAALTAEARPTAARAAAGARAPPARGGSAR
jgi:hypothetical protein